MMEIIVTMLGKFFWAIGGSVFFFAYNHLTRIRPTKRLWRLKDPSKLMILSATSINTFTGVYHRPATGIGQVRALMLINTSLTKAYKNIKIRNVLFSEDQLQHNIENDLICLGGPKNNKYTRMFLEEMQAYEIVNQTEDSITWYHDVAEPIVFKPKADDDQTISRDYGLIIRTNNLASSTDSTLTIFSGGHTYGTIAAAKYYTENVTKRMKLFERYPKTYIAVVSCGVVDGYPITIQLEKEFKSTEGLSEMKTKRNRQELHQQ